MKKAEITAASCLIVTILAVFASPFLLSNPQEGKLLLERQGYKNISFTGVSYFSCGRDIRCDSFVVTNFQGQSETIYISGSLFSRPVIRL